MANPIPRSLSHGSATDSEPTQAGKWLVAASVMIGTFLSVMDATVVNVAMPHMMGSFGRDLLSITWVSTAYSIAEIIMITMSAWMTTLLGRKRLFLASMILFTVGSVLAGTSKTLTQMIFYRVVQGIGGGSLMPCSQAIARETFPPAEQGMAMAIYSMGVVLAPAIGPVIGGWLVDNYGWQWVFYINVPFCIVGLMMVSTFVHDPSYLKRGVARIDWTGIGLLTVGLTMMQVVLERGEEVDWFSNHWIVIGTVVASASIVALVVWELYNDEPVINFRLFRNVPLSAGSGLGMVVGFALFGSSFLLPQFTETLLNYPAYQAGMVLMPRAVAMLLTMPLVGRLYNHVSPRILIAVGIVALVVGYWELSQFTLTVSFANFLPILVMTGIGMGAAMVTMSTVSLSTINRSQMTGASSLFTLSRRVSGNIAYATLATLLARRSQVHRSELISAVGGTNPVFRSADAQYRSLLSGYGIASTPSRRPDLAMLDGMVNRQATMMAYNDCFWLMAVMLVAVLPFLFLLPKTGVSQEAEAILE
ncbi:DHA2 family efflux MFS transporter permease subunit [Candidatus Binatus sp.]|uniref:DHA2 family efflux MFS transporter permease subunit n=1 Tax=Candidatus Binatus sp. TaxID=2811406 RepID=UPI003C345628